MRDDEAGTPLLFQGQVRSSRRHAARRGHRRLWHADDAGFYSQFAPGLPDWNLPRHVCTPTTMAATSVNTMQPAPYQIPHDGSCGKLIAAAGLARLAPRAHPPEGLRPRTPADHHAAVLRGRRVHRTDIADAVKPELMLAPDPRGRRSGNEVTYDFVLDPA